MKKRTKTFVVSEYFKAGKGWRGNAGPQSLSVCAPDSLKSGGNTVRGEEGKACYGWGWG